MVKTTVVQKQGGLRPPTVNVELPGSVEEAKAVLLKADENGNSVYDHLSEIILSILEQRPKNALQQFENFSTHVKQTRFNAKESSGIRERDIPTIDSKLATLRSNLFKNLENTAEGEDVPTLPNEGDMQDLLEEASMFEWGGVGLGREETVRIMLAMKQLLESNPLKTVRFFGKIFGRGKDYIIVESEYKDGEAPDDQEPQEEKKTQNEDLISADDSEAEEEEQPKAAPQKPAEVESEVGVGTNRFTYWVTNSPGEQWTRLPNVTPAEIVAARKIYKYFTGNLETEISVYPALKEKNYLRAQIARIAAGTVISPKGFYNGEDEDPESGELPALQANQEFEGMDPSDLLKLNNWVHHTPHILNQGRCTFFRMVKEKDEEDEEEEQPEEPAEQGPKLLTEISEDSLVGKFDAWSARLSTTINTKFAHVVLRSNRWPGAYACAKDDKFANVYVGFGLKYNDKRYYPPLPTPPQKEAEAPQEAVDPSVEEEEQREQMQKAQEAQDPSSEQEDSEEEEEEEDD